MCHVLLLLPVLALPVFWFWPLEIALPLYGVAGVASVGIYALVYRAWRTPLAHGPQTLIGAIGCVISAERQRAILRLGGELWLADVQGQPLTPGEQAEVVGIHGLQLKARKVDTPRLPSARNDSVGA